MKWILILILTLAPYLLSAKFVTVTASETDAKISVNGEFVGYGSHEFQIQKGECVLITLEKPGFLTIKKRYCYTKTNKPPNKDHLIMQVDDAYSASSVSQVANIDIEVKPNQKRSDLENWQIVSQIILSYFDVLEIVDRETGYLRTAWNAQNFNGYTVRTRVIVKQSSIDPLTYKIKVVSEASDEVANVKQDERFKEWGRLLRKYETLPQELQTRL